MKLWQEPNQKAMHDKLVNEQAKGFVKKFAWHPTFIKNVYGKDELVWFEYYWRFPIYIDTLRLFTIYTWDKRSYKPEARGFVI